MHVPAAAALLCVSDSIGVFGFDLLSCQARCDLIVWGLSPACKVYTGLVTGHAVMGPRLCHSCRAVCVCCCVGKEGVVLTSMVMTGVDEGSLRGSYKAEGAGCLSQACLIVHETLQSCRRVRHSHE